MTEEHISRSLSLSRSISALFLSPFHIYLLSRPFCSLPSLTHCFSLLHSILPPTSELRHFSLCSSPHLHSLSTPSPLLFLLCLSLNHSLSLSLSLTHSLTLSLALSLCLSILSPTLPSLSRFRSTLSPWGQGPGRAGVGCGGRKRRASAGRSQQARGHVAKEQRQRPRL